VIITGRTQSKLDAAVKLIKEAGGEVHAVAADVGSDADNKRIVDTTLELYGRVDLSFVIAGTIGMAGFSEVSTKCSLLLSYTIVKANTNNAAMFVMFDITLCR
jgi:NAD(P)-dependent dehydrogenase (short-subunit alcohol dehydrogenase family)